MSITRLCVLTAAVSGRFFELELSGVRGAGVARLAAASAPISRAIAL
jgi:hypothetical protein